jgi:hypothetical protein
VGAADGRAVGRTVGAADGRAVGREVGRAVGSAVGREVGRAVGSGVGRALGLFRAVHPGTLGLSVQTPTEPPVHWHPKPLALHRFLHLMRVQSHLHEFVSGQCQVGGTHHNLQPPLESWRVGAPQPFPSQRTRIGGALGALHTPLAQRPLRMLHSFTVMLS